MFDRPANASRAAALALILAATLALPAGGAIYRWVDAESRIHYTDSPPPKASAKRIVVEPAPPPPAAAPPAQGPAAASRKPAAGQKVVMYSAEWCGYCKRAAAYLRKRGIPFENVDVENTSRGVREYAQLGGRGVPIILVGSERMDGYDEGSLAAMLASAGW
jgi:glutaredoxin